MRPHWHLTIDNILMYGFAAIITISAVHLAAVPLARSRIKPVRLLGEAMSQLPFRFATK